MRHAAAPSKAREAPLNYHILEENKRFRRRCGRRNKPFEMSPGHASPSLRYRVSQQRRCPGACKGRTGIFTAARLMASLCKAEPADIRPSSKEVWMVQVEFVPQPTYLHISDGAASRKRESGDVWEMSCLGDVMSRRCTYVDNVLQQDRDSSMMLLT
jgi:hypothetical protein